MRNIIAIPLLALAVVLQSTIVSQFSLLAGYADLILVMLAAFALQKGVTTAFQWAFLASLQRMSADAVETVVREAQKRGDLIGVTISAMDDGPQDPWALPPSQSRTHDTRTVST